MSAALATLLGTDRDYFLLDSFEGLPEAKTIDGEAAIRWQANVNGQEYFDNCRAELEWAERAMATSGASRYQLVQGWFDQTIPKIYIESGIAILRLDGDWYESTMICLTHFFPQVVPGGIIIIDDYDAWDGCARAVHDYLSQHQRPERLQRHERVVYIRKRDATGSPST